MSESNGNGNGNAADRYFAMLSMEAIEHKIGLRNPTNRVFYSILRCSICYPHQSEIALRPEINGTFEKFVAQLHERIKKQRPVRKEDIKEEATARDHRGIPVPLNWQDLERITNLWRGQIGKALERLRTDGVLAEGWPFRLIVVPMVVPPFEYIGPSVYCAETENSDKSFIINKSLKKLQNFLGVPLHCAVDSNKDAQEAAAQFLEQLCAVRSRKEKEARNEIRSEIAERGAVSGIFIERASENTAKKGKENTQEGRGPQTSPAAEPESGEPRPELWPGFLFAARLVGMLGPEEDAGYLIPHWRKLSIEERKAAIEGIELNRAAGTYSNPQFVPSAKTYILEKRWLRPVRAKAATASFSDRRQAEREAFMRRTFEELEYERKLREEQEGEGGDYDA